MPFSFRQRQRVSTCFLCLLFCGLLPKSHAMATVSISLGDDPSPPKTYLSEEFTLTVTDDSPLAMAEIKWYHDSINGWVYHPQCDNFQQISAWFLKAGSRQIKCVITYDDDSTAEAIQNIPLDIDFYALGPNGLGGHQTISPPTPSTLTLDFPVWWGSGATETIDQPNTYATVEERIQRPGFDSGWVGETPEIFYLAKAVPGTWVVDVKSTGIGAALWNSYPDGHIFDEFTQNLRLRIVTVTGAIVYDDLDQTWTLQRVKTSATTYTIREKP